MGIYETIKKLEELRKKLRVCACVPFIFMVVIFILPLLSVGNPERASQMFMLISLISVVVVIQAFRRMTEYSKEYKALYKSTFVTGMLSEFFDDVFYDWQHGFTEQAVREFGLVKLGNRFHTEDYLSASYKGIHFVQADVKVQYHSSSGKNSHTTTYFSGRMFVFDNPLKKVFSVQVFSDNFKYRAGNPNGFRMNKVDLESVAFNKAFDVKAVQEIDAFYMLTPQMIERLTMIKNQYGNLAVHFANDKILVGINCGMKAFDGSITRKIDYNTEREQARKDSMVIINLIETLKLMSEEKTNTV